jgi:hypothetical protein
MRLLGVLPLKSHLLSLVALPDKDKKRERFLVIQEGGIGSVVSYRKH